MLRMPYGQDEVLSAFHKSLRKGDVPLACYFAKCMVKWGQLWKVKQYMLFIVFEETMSLELYRRVLALYRMPDEDITYIHLFEVISAFALTTKKWETAAGRELTELHFHNAIRFTEDCMSNKHSFHVKDIAKFQEWQDILKTYDCCYNRRSKTFKKTVMFSIPEIFTILGEAIATKDYDKAIYLALVYYCNRDKLPFEKLGVFCNSSFAQGLYNEMLSLNGKYCYPYNYIMLFYSFVSGVVEPGTVGKAEFSYLQKIDTRSTKALQEGRFVEMPLYALDNHTAAGKQLMRNIKVRYNTKLKGVDLRYSGNWYGVLWRIHAIRQFGSIEQSWETVNIDQDYERLIEKCMHLKEQAKELSED